MGTLVCPICGARFEAEQTPAMPFCSRRCRDIDLGRWLDERYSVPALSKELDEEDTSPTPPPSKAAESESP